MFLAFIRKTQLHIVVAVTTGDCSMQLVQHCPNVSHVHCAWLFI